MSAEPFPLDPVRGPGAFPLPLRLRVLVVDDSRDGADTTAQLLTVCGADVRVCYDGPTALTALETFRPDACVLDMAMPGMDGCELAGRIRASSAGPPPRLIALTAYGDEKARGRAAAAGFDAHLVKPIDPAILLGTLGGVTPREQETTGGPPPGPAGGPH